MEVSPRYPSRVTTRGSFSFALAASLARMAASAAGRSSSMLRMAAASIFGSGALRALSAAAESASASCSGVSADMKAMRRESGDHTGAPAPVSRSVSGHASPPSASGRIHTCPGPSCRDWVNAIIRPSGDQRGAPIPRALVQVRRRGPLPSVLAIHRSRRYRFSALSTSVTTNTTRCPSGDRFTPPAFLR